jgi:hypothetical protein
MLWFKRNLFFVLSILVGLGLIGWATYQYFNVSAKNAEVVGALKNDRDQLKNLKSKSPQPSDEAIQAAREDKKRVDDFLNQFRTAYAPFPPAPKLDDRGFKNHLEETIGQLRLEATNAEVALPNNFSFSFSSQMEKMSYHSESIDGWLEQLGEVKVICEILYNARIAALDSIQRVHVSEDDTSANDYIIGAEITTNKDNLWSVEPFKIAFRGYSEQIAAVLEGFARSPHCWIVKDVDVKPSLQGVPIIIPSDEPQQMTPMPTPYGGYRPYNPYNDPRMRNQMMGGPGGRPGYGGRPGDGMPYRPYVPPPSGYVPPPAPTVPVTVLSPKILFVNIALDLVKIKPPEVDTNKAPSKASSPPRGRPVPPAAPAAPTSP